MFKKYLNPWTQTQFAPPTTSKRSVENSVQLHAMTKKKLKAPKKQKMVNYTTIRKHVPSLDRSLDSNDSAIKILKYPKAANDSSVSSKSGSRVNATLNNRNLTDKSLNLNQFKPIKDSKVIRFSKDLKQGTKRTSKPKQKEGVSK